jgi:hypothetical protein
MSWFEEYCGFPISVWDYTFDSLPKHVKSDAGIFETYSINDLFMYADVEPDINISKKPNPKKLTILVRDSFIESHLFDTSAIQKSNGSNILVQVASNFNCLEVASHNTNPFRGSFIENLMYDLTQGPAAAGGAIAGTLLRLSLHKVKPINLLENTSLKPINGKLYYRRNEQYNFNKKDVKIGLQMDVKPNFLRMNKTYEYDNKSDVRIDQIYTSTCISNYENSELSLKLLESAYLGTYLSGILRKSKKIILTLIGGGCFRNNMDMILDVLIKTHDAYSGYLKDDCEIILPIYMPDKDLILKIMKYYKNNTNVEIIKITSPQNQNQKQRGYYKKK